MFSFAVDMLSFTSPLLLCKAVLTCQMVTMGALGRIVSDISDKDAAFSFLTGEMITVPGSCVYFLISPSDLCQNKNPVKEY